MGSAPGAVLSRSVTAPAYDVDRDVTALRPAPPAGAGR
jgi:hypothetical protein